VSGLCGKSDGLRTPLNPKENPKEVQPQRGSTRFAKSEPNGTVINSKALPPSLILLETVLCFSDL